METIKIIIKQFYPILIMVSCILFVIGIFFSGIGDENKGVFKEVGNIFKPVVQSDENKSNGLNHIGSSVTTFVPTIKYVGGAQIQGSYIIFKEQLEVTKEDGSVVSGNTEDEFAIYLLDIKTLAGDSALICLPAEEIAEMEEIPAPFVYEKEQDILCCFVGGTYMVHIKVYGANGGQEIYEFKLPVEIN